MLEGGAERHSQRIHTCRSIFVVAQSATGHVMYCGSAAARRFLQLRCKHTAVAFGHPQESRLRRHKIASEPKGISSISGCMAKFQGLFSLRAAARRTLQLRYRCTSAASGHPSERDVAAISPGNLNEIEFSLNFQGILPAKFCVQSRQKNL